MAEEWFEIKCVRCGHGWHVNLDDLDVVEQAFYKGQATQKTYRVQCPNCGTYNVFTVAFGEEGADG